MDSIEVELSQGWTKRLTLCFENQQASSQRKSQDFFEVKQVHGADIYILDSRDLAKTDVLAEADGMYIQGDECKACKPLLIKTADCCPLFMIDRVQKSIVALHAGWRGLAKGIHRIPFEKGWLDPKTTWVWLGPSLNGSSFEVRQDMWEQFPEHRQSTIFEQTQDSQVRLFHSWKFLEQDLAKWNVELFYNVEVDTLKEPAFASYRRSKAEKSPLTQQNWSWIGFNRPSKI